MKNRIKRCLILISLLTTLFCGNLRAQEKDRAFRASIVYLDEAENNVLYGPGFTYLLFGKAGNRHEFTLERILSKKHERPNYMNYQFLIGSSYQYNVHFFKLSNIQPYLGLGTNWWYEYRYTDPELSSFKTSTTHLRGSLHLAPSCHIRKNRWFADAGLRYDFLTFSMKRQRVDNPAIPISQQRTGGSDLLFLPDNFTLSLGVGYQF